MLGQPVVVALDDVVVGPRKRPLDAARVTALAGSIAELGLLQPIVVTDTMGLIAGRHRLEAARRLGWQTIPARIAPLDELRAELAEIDENLVRNELTVLEQGEHLVRRNEILIALGERATWGGQFGNRNASKNGGETVSPSFRGQTKQARGDMRDNDRPAHVAQNGTKWHSVATFEVGETASPPKTTADLATEMGIGERSTQHRLQIARGIVPEVKEAITATPLADQTGDLLALARMGADEQQAVIGVEGVMAGKVSVRQAVGLLRREAQDARWHVTDDEAAVTAVEPTVAEPATTGENYQLLVCDVGDLWREIEPGSVDWIITDPPYPREYLDCYEELAATAARILKPGGGVLAMCGQSYLPEVLDRMRRHLTYHWTLAYLTPGGQSPQIWPRKVNTFWKPVLWMTNGSYDGEWAGDVLGSDTNENDKRFHKWGQSESGMGMLFNRFTRPGQLVVDPFVGGGTCGVVALRAGCRFIGADNDSAAVAQTAARMAQEARSAR